MSSNSSIRRNRNTSGNMNNNNRPQNREIAPISGSSFPSTSREVHFEADNGDLIYLFTVDSSPAGRIVQEINLESENSDIVTATENKSKPRKNSNQVKDSSSQKKRKTKSAESSERSSKRPDINPRCSICKIHYDVLIGDNENMCIASCGHVFCHPCVRNGIEECNVCGRKIQLLRKLFL